MKLLLVVQRYGPEVTGGSEALCRAIAQRLAERHDVSVATSCATDYVTWANVLPPGTSSDGRVTVHRFESARQRPLQAFWRLSDRIFDDQASAEEQAQWFALNGPDVPGLLDFVRARGRDYDRVLFFTYRYAPSWFGLPLVADRAILVPTAEHDQLIRSSTILAPYFRLPRAYLFLTPEEEAMVANVARAALPPSAVIGSGIDPAPDRPSRAALDALGVPQDFLVYLGRVDRNKGCDALVRHYAAYVASGGSRSGDAAVDPGRAGQAGAAGAAGPARARAGHRRRARRPAGARARPGDAVAVREPEPRRPRSVEPRARR